MEVNPLLCAPDNVQIGDRVLIFSPAYVAGRVGVVYGREDLSDGQPSDRWLIQVPPENMMLSLNRDEFEPI